MNQNFFTYATSAFEHPHIRVDVRFGHSSSKGWPGWPKPPTPIELMMNTAARDKIGFPTKRDIIDAEYTMIEAPHD